MTIARQVATAVAAMTMMAATTVQAQTLVTGTARGCFSSTASCTPTLIATTPFAVYTGAAFSGTTFGTPNRVSFGGNPLGGIDNFGTVSLSGLPADYNGKFFNLMLSFTNPSTANSTFLANLTGQVAGTDRGSLEFVFANPDQTFGFGAGNSFTVHVNNLDVNPGQVASITGNVTVTTPEPSSMALLGTGLVGLVPMFRRRKNEA